MYPPGLRLRQIRENMGLPYRDVEKASCEIAVKRGRPDFILHISRLGDIENRNVVPRLHKLYSLATILHVDPLHRRSRMVQRIRPPNVFRGNSQGLPLRLGSRKTNHASSCSRIRSLVALPRCGKHRKKQKLSESDRGCHLPGRTLLVLSASNSRRAFRLQE